MTIVFFGSNVFGLPTLEALKNSSHRLKAVVSTPSKPQGRNLKPQDSPIKEWAMKQDVPYFDFIKEHPSTILSALKQLNSDVFVVISFGVILSKEALELPRLMGLNAHASLLPKYRGASPMQAAILNNDDRTGVTIIKMSERLDAGDMLLKKELSIDRQETTESLEKRLSILTAEATLEALDHLEKGSATLTPQDEKKATYTQKIKKEAGKICWTENAVQIETKIRAYRPWPGSFFFLKGKRVLLCKAQPFRAYPSAAPGTVMQWSDKTGLVVVAGEKSSLQLEQLQLEGRNAMDWKEFARGFPVPVGAILE